MNEDDDQRRWVLVEKMAGDMEAIRELVSLVPAIKETVDRHTDQLDAIDGRLTSVEVRLGSVEVRLKSVETDVKEFKVDMKEVKGYVIEHHEAIAELKAASHTH